MTLRELINQVTDNDSESSVLDYELDIWHFDENDRCDSRTIQKVEIGELKTGNKIYIKVDKPHGL